MTGEHAALWYLVGGAGVALDPARRPLWRRALLGVALTQLVNVSIKGIVRRRRPVVDDLPHLVSVPTSLSFPSSHASTSFAAARGFGRLLPSGPLHLVAGAMALSRVYLGVHYPSDIAVGAALGSAISNAVRS